MNRKEFYRSFAATYGTTIYSAKDYCYKMFEHLENCIEEHGRVYIKGFGTFKKKKIGAHRVGNLAGGDPIIIPEKEKIVFEPTPKDEDYEDDDD